MIRIHNDATGDLRAIMARAPGDAAKLVALIQQLKADPKLLSGMNEAVFGGNRIGPIGVKPWRTMRNQTGQKPVFRLRAWDLEAAGLHYRLLYLYNWPDQSLNILAVVAKRDFDYDAPNDPVRQRVYACIQREFPGA